MKLKKIAPLFLLLLLSVGCSTSNETADQATLDKTTIEETATDKSQAVESVETPEEFNFRGDTYVLSAITSDGKETINSYFPEGESETQWTTLVNLFELPQINDASKVVETLKTAVLEVDPKTPYAVWEEESSTGIDFLTYDEATNTFVYTFFSYQDNPSGKGMIGRQYSEQFSFEEADAFVENDNPEREKIREDVLAQSFPSVTKE